MRETPAFASSGLRATSVSPPHLRPGSPTPEGASSSRSMAICRTIPADIPRLLDVARDHDIVCGWRKARKDAFLTRHVPSVVANWLIGMVTGVRLHDQGCSLKVLRAEVVKPLRLSPGMHRYLPAIASQLGGRVTEVVVNHRPRRFGRSRYGLSRTFGVVRDIVRLPALMREAVKPAGPSTPLYEIQETLGSRDWR